jgi:hypothetical protein
MATANQHFTLRSGSFARVKQMATVRGNGGFTMMPEWRAA